MNLVSLLNAIVVVVCIFLLINFLRTNIHACIVKYYLSF